MTMTETAVGIAHAYARIGIPVFPLEITWDPAKRKTNKKPLTDHGFKDATTDPDEIERLFTRRRPGPDGIHAVGLTPGPAGIVVVDLDISEQADGIACWQDLCRLHGEPDNPPVVTTASGGQHLWFTKPEGVDYSNSHDLGPGIDVRADAGYVVAPGTHTPWGVWEWDTDDTPLDGVQPPPATTWMQRRLHSSTGNGHGPAIRTEHTAHIDNADDQQAITALQALGGHGIYHKTIPTGDGVATCYYLTRPGKTTGVSATVGFVGPGVTKIWTPNWEGLDEGRVYEAGELAAIVEGVDYVSDLQVMLDHLPKAAEGDTAPTSNGENRFAAAALTTADLANIPPADPLAPGWLNRQSIAFLYGPPKKGKTFVALDLALSVSTGTRWVGGPTRQTHVLYALGEGIRGLHKRVDAWAQHHGNPRLDNVTWLPTVPQLANTIDVGALLDYIETMPTLPGLVIVDTLARAAVGVEENSAKEMGVLVRQLDLIKEQTGACVLVVHHTGKDSERGLRGSNSTEGALDTGIAVKGDVKAMTLEALFQKDDEEPAPVNLSGRPSGESIVMVRNDSAVFGAGIPESFADVLTALLEVDAGGTTGGVWRDNAEERFGVSKATFHRAQKWLLDQGDVVNISSSRVGLYTTPSIDGE